MEDAFACLIHRNAPSKHQYDPSEVKANFDFTEFVANDSTFLSRQDEIVSQITTGIITRINMTEHIKPHEYVEYKGAIENSFEWFLFNRKLTVSINGVVFGCMHVDLPEEFHVGITGCKSKNKFYEMTIED